MWYNEPIDYVCGVAERKGSLNHRLLLGLWYNESMIISAGRALACCGEKQRMLYSTEKNTKFTTEFVKMVVESQ